MSEERRPDPRPRIPIALHALAAGFRNRAIRRVLVAFVGFSLAEWASWIAILVYAYRQGGTTETGIVALVQLAPSILVAPVAASMGDRVRRETALRISYLAQACSMGATAVLLLLGAPTLLIYASAVVAATSVTLTRPIQAAILPSLARTPAELTAANVATGAVETLSMLVGPALAGVALAASDAGVVFAGSAALTLSGALLTLGIRAQPHAYVGDTHEDEQAQASGLRGAVAGTLASLRMLAAEERPRLVVMLIGGASILWGALDVLLVVLAIGVLGVGEAGVGYLNAAMGAGGILGAAATVLLIGRHRLAGPLVAGLLLWAVPLALVGILPSTLAACLLLGLAGIGRVVVDVAGRTLLQRVAPERMLARVFGVLEGIDMASLAIGSAAAPLLVALFGPGGAFGTAGLALAALTALSWPRLARADAAGTARPREVSLLRGIPMFEPLSPPAIERLAASLLPVEAAAGSEVITQGEHGDRYFIITRGRVRVSIDGRVVRELGHGDGFGEIALLRNVPRTATVTALEEVHLAALERRTFLEAVTGQPVSAARADALATERLDVNANASR